MKLIFQVNYDTTQTGANFNKNIQLNQKVISELNFKELL